MSGNNETIASPSPGEILKRCREFQDMTLEDAADATKISADHLQALEENRCDQFASLAYLKGFARIYATSLGLNPDDIIKLYARLYCAEDPAMATSPSSKSAAKKKKRSGFPLQKLIIPAVLLLLIVITSIIVNRSPVRQSPVPPPASHPPAVAHIVQTKPSSSRMPISAPDKKKQLTESSRDNQEHLPATTPVVLPRQETRKGFIVSLKIVRNSSLTVTIDSSSPQHHEMTAGDHIEWRGDSQITLELSDAGAVEAQLNGKPLAPLGGEGIPKVVTVREDGVK